MKNKRNIPKRRHEFVDPNPISLPVKFQQPPTLAEQIARFMGAHERYVAQQGHEHPSEADDFDIPDEDSPESPHELVFDAQLNREIPRYEKEHLDTKRQQFDEALRKKIAEDRKNRELMQRVNQPTEPKKAPKKSGAKAPTSDDQAEES